MKKILLAPNSFKGCSNSVLIAESLSKILARNGKFLIKESPISDGGDGFLDVCRKYFNLEILTYEISKPYSDDLFTVSVGYSAEQRKLYIESAEVIGLKCIPTSRRHPLLSNTKGLGELFKLVIDSGLNVDKVILGIGGTGTSDLGLGFCSIFGLKLYDIFDKEADIIPKNYSSVKSFKWHNAELPLQIEIIADVDNPLLGENGAVRTFSGQKGASKEEIGVLELGFEKLIKLFINNKLIESADGLSGAGGGLAAGLQIFFNAGIIKSREFIKMILSEKIQSFAPDLILTGEGAFDMQSLMNKGAKTVIDIGVSSNIPVLLVCGSIDKDSINGYGNKIIPIELQSFFGSEKESIGNLEKGLEFAAEKIINYISGA